MAQILLNIHNYITNLFPNVSDFWLHFFVLGFFGLLLYSILCALGVRNLMSWFWGLFTVAIISGVIELVQLYTNTGSFQYLDIVASLAGYLVLTYAGVIREWLP